MPQLISGLLFVGPLVFAGVSDLRSRTIPYSACILLTLAGLISFSPANLFGLLLAVPFFFAAGRGRGGAGDTLLIAAACFALGFLPGLAGLILALFLFLLFALGGTVRLSFSDSGSDEIPKLVKDILKSAYLRCQAQ